MTTPSVPIYPAAGAAVPVHAVTGPSIGGPAIPVYVVSDGRPTLGQPPRRVKLITDADLTINGGNYWIEGRPFAMPVAVSTATSGDEGNVPIPVYAVNAWPGAAVTPHWSTLGGTIAAANIAAWTPKGAASLAASYVQYGTLGTGLTVGAAPTFNSAQGWIFDGISQYLNTNIIPVNAQTQTVAIRYSGVPLSILYKSPFGSRTAYPTRVLELTVGTNGDDQTYFGDGSANSFAGRVLSGTVIIAGANCYVNGTFKDVSAPWGGTSIEEIYIGAGNQGGAASQFADIVVAGFVYYDVALTPAQVALLNTALGAL